MEFKVSTNFELSNMSFDADNMILSTTYSDVDGNLPWFKSIQIISQRPFLTHI